MKTLINILKIIIFADYSFKFPKKIRLFCGMIHKKFLEPYVKHKNFTTT